MRGRPGKKGGVNHDGGRRTGLSAAHIPEKRRLRKKSAAMASPEEEARYAGWGGGVIQAYPSTAASSSPGGDCDERLRVYRAARLHARRIMSKGILQTQAF